MTLRTLFKENRLFFILSFLFVFTSTFIWLDLSKADGFYLLNSYHNTFLDTFFTWFTYFGDGFFCVATALLFFVSGKRYLGLMAFSSYAISGIIAQALKYFIIEPRPAVYLKDTSYPYFIDDVTLHNLHGFPSGHSASAFALAAVLSFSAKNKYYSILFLTAAMVVGYTRIYLGQHFIDDVLAGAVIGLVSAVVCWVYFKKPFEYLSARKKN